MSSSGGSLFSGGSVDRSGGLDPAFDLVALRPADDDPFFGENHALWLWDDTNRVGIHTYLKTLQHIAHFGLRRETINIHLPDGTLLLSEQDGPGTHDNRVAAGPALRCECVAPFDQWRFQYDGTAAETTPGEMRAGLLTHRPVRPLSFDLEIRTVAPPWQLGDFTPDDQMGWARLFIGNLRYEQLVSATGTVTTADRVFNVSAGGMRTHRLGTRNTHTFPGHSWCTAIFPSGRSFGVQRFCGADGLPHWEEAFVSDGFRRVKAHVTALPIFTGQLPGERLVLQFESELGDARINGELVGTNFVSCMPQDTQRFCWGIDRSEPTNRIMSQGLARYDWDSEVGTGMIERSVRAFEMPENEQDPQIAWRTQL